MAGVSPGPLFARADSGALEPQGPLETYSLT